MEGERATAGSAFFLGLTPSVRSAKTTAELSFGGGHL